MSEAYVPAAIRREVREQAHGRCEYCLLAEDDAFFPHEPDHIIAVKHGGTSVPENLAWSCFDCNRFKGSDIASLDSVSGNLVSLFNPRQGIWYAFSARIWPDCSLDANRSCYCDAIEIQPTSARRGTRNLVPDKPVSSQSLIVFEDCHTLIL